MRIAHLVSPYDELSERNGSATLRVAIQLARVANKSGDDAIVVGGMDRLTDVDLAVEALKPRWLDRNLNYKIRDAVDLWPKTLAGVSFVAPRLVMDRLPFSPDVYVLHNLPFVDLPAVADKSEKWLYVHNRIMVRASPRVLRRRLSTFDRIICVSDYVRTDLLMRVDPTENSEIGSRMLTVTNRLGPEFIRHTSDPASNRFDLLFVGRLVPEKGLHVLIESAHRLSSEDDKPIRLGVAGGRSFLPGESLTPYERRVRSMGTDGPAEVEFLGPRPPSDIPALMRGTSILVVPSIWPEPFGLVTLEGLASGTPTVATSTGASLEFPVASGLVLVDADNVDSLATALRDLLRDPERRSQLGSNGRRWALGQSWEDAWNEIMA